MPWPAGSPAPTLELLRALTGHKQEEEASVAARYVSSNKNYIGLNGNNSEAEKPISEGRRPFVGSFYLLLISSEM